jgi:hypothetical protein
MENQSGQVLNTFSNLQQVKRMPDNGYICIQNAYESTQRLLTNLEMMYSKIKMHYTAILKNTKPEEVLTGHFHGYVRDVVDKLFFPIKVDDSITRFRGPILDTLHDIHSDTKLLEQIISAAVQTKRTASESDGWAEILKMLDFIKANFDDIESYVQQLDDKNQNYIRTTRQKLTYMLSMDTSIKGDIVSILRDAKDRPDDYWERIGACFTMFDVRQISDTSFYKPRIRHIRDGGEPLGIDSSDPVTQDDMDAVIDMRIARFLGTKVNEFAQQMLAGKESVEACDFALINDDDYLMAMFLAMNSTNSKCVYSYQAENGMTTKGRYGIANFTMRSKEDAH